MTTLQAVIERFLDETGGDIGFYGTGTVAATTLTDTTLLDNKNWNSNQLKYWWIWLPAGTTTDIVKPATTLAAGGVLTQGTSVNYSATGSAKSYRLLHPEWHPTRHIIPLANRALEQAWEWWRAPLSAVADADGEASGVTNWTGSSATITKDTTTVFAGTQSIKVANSGGGGYAQSATFEGVHSRTFRITAKVYISSGTATINVYDVTNSAVIASTTATGVGAWQDVMLVGTFPDTCYQAAVRIGGSQASATTYWDNVQLYWNLLTYVSLPSWVTQWRLEDGQEAIRIYEQVNRLGTIDAWSARAYDLRLVDKSRYQIVQQPSAVNSLHIELDRNLSYWQWPLIIEAHRPYADFGSVSANTDTSACPLRLWVAAMKMLAARERPKTLGDRLEQWTAEYEREQRRGQSHLNTPVMQSPGLSYMRFG